MKILVVDDEPLVRRSLARALKTRNHDVLEAGDGASGLEMWKSSDPDLVFLDVIMPGLTGPQVLAAVGSPRRAKVILMSAFSGGHDVKGDVSQRVDLFLPKPFEDIFQIVEEAEELLK